MATTFSEAYRDYPLHLNHIIPLDFSSYRTLPDSHAWPQFDDDHDHFSSSNNIGSIDDEESSIPIIDLMDPNAMEQIGLACEKWGAFQLKNHGIPLKVIEDVEVEARKLFSLPFEHKLKALRTAGGATGYGIARISPFFPKFMWHEGFTIMGSPSNDVKKIWPNDNKTFCDTIEEYQKQMKNLAEKLTNMIFTILGISQDKKKWVGSKNHCGATQLNHYPSCPEPNRAMGLAPHTDTSLLTILHQSQTSGLQIFKEGVGAHLLNGGTNGLVGNPSTANALATKMYEERLKLPLQRDSLEDAAMKQRFGDQLLDPNHASILKSSAATGPPSGQVLHGSAGAMSPQVQARSQQLPGSTSDIKSEINPVLNPRAAGPEGSLMAIPGSNQGSNNLTLKGWPLTGLDQLRSGLLQQQKPFIQAPQPFHQLPMLTPQHQHQLMLAQNLVSPSASDDSRRLRMLLNNRNMGVSKDGLSNSVGDVVSNVGSPLQAGGPPFPRGDTDMLMKLKLAQLHQHQQQQNANPQQQQQLQQHALSNQQSQSSNHNMHQQDKVGGGGGGSVTMDGSMSNSFRGNDQVSKNQTGRKRKQPVSSSGPANSSGTANTAGPSPSSAPSTPSTHTPSDVMSMPALPHNGNSSKPLMMFGTDGAGTLTSPSNQLADVDRFVEDGSLDDNVESFLSHDDADARDGVGRCMDVSKGFTFSEVNSVRASTSKVICSHFSSDGKLLASGGHDKKAVLWFTDSLKQKATLEEHSSLITDVRFSPSMPRLATSSYDRTVRVWDVDNPGYSLRTFTGHNASVMSLDFHPNNDDLICSCDFDGEIRYWSINNGSCARVSKGGTAQMRFQPRLGRYLAAAAENVVSILDVETQQCRYSLKGHTKSIHSVCWDPSGEFLASVSEDSVRVWTLGSGGEGECVHELSCNGNKFHSCVFHPTYSSLLVIGCYQSLELWNMTENKTMTLSAHEGLIAALAVSTVNGLVASASHDKFVKLWK